MKLSRAVTCRPVALRCKNFLPKRQLAVCRAEGRNVQTLRLQLDDMEQESLEVVEQARKAAEKRHQLSEVISGMDKLALACLERGDDERARTILEEKAQLQEKADGAAEKLETLVRLDVKLQEAIKAKKIELFRLEAGRGAFRDDEAGVQIKIGEDGKPYFERTGSPSKRSVPETSSRPDYWTTPLSSPASSTSSTWGSGSSASARSETSFDDAYLSSPFSVDFLLGESDRKLNDKFVELERQQLERSLRSSPGGSAQPSAPPPPPQEPPATPSPPPGVLNFQSTSVDAPQEPAKPTKVVMSEWWTMGQNALMEGALANLKQHHVPMYNDAATAVMAVTNARIRGQDPSPQQILSLVVLALVSPEQVAASFWGVDQPVGVRRMPDTLKLAIFSVALNYVVEDLLGNHSNILTGDEGLRSKEARALLVALAGVLDLKGSEASDFSVRVICRAIRTSLINALVPLRQATQNSDPALLAKAEADLSALHRLLTTLPCSLPIATKHVAAVEVTEQIRKVASPIDALRLDRVYASVSGEDSTGTTIRAILGSIAQDR